MSAAAADGPGVVLPDERVHRRALPHAGRGGRRGRREAALYVDCTGDGLGRRGTIPVFAPGRITLRPVRTCQPVFSAAVVAHVEATKPDDAVKNAYCRPVPHPKEPLDWLTMTMAFNDNQLQWFQDAEMMAWLSGARLNVVSHLGMEPPSRKDMAPLADRLRTVNDKLEVLLNSAGTRG